MNKGFTLIELLIYLAIFSVLIGISLPVYQSIKPNLALNGDARQLAIDLRYAQQLAVSTQARHAIIINPSQNNYELRQIENNMAIFTKQFKNDIRIASSTITDNKAIFNVTGAAINYGEIFLTNEINTTNVEIKPSGYIKINKQ